MATLSLPLRPSFDQIDLAAHDFQASYRGAASIRQLGFPKRVEPAIIALIFQAWSGLANAKHVQIVMFVEAFMVVREEKNGEHRPSSVGLAGLDAPLRSAAEHLPA